MLNVPPKWQATVALLFAIVALGLGLGWHAHHDYGGAIALYLMGGWLTVESVRPD